MALHIGPGRGSGGSGSRVGGLRLQGIGEGAPCAVSHDFLTSSESLAGKLEAL